MTFAIRLAVVGFATAVFFSAAPSWAIPEFRAEFVAKYVKPDSKEAKDVAFKKAVDEAKCSICHQGESKKNRNVYGKALEKLLDEHLDKKNKKKIQKALDEVAGMKINPDDPKSPTFGDRIKAGDVPAPPVKK